MEVNFHLPGLRQNYPLNMLIVSLLEQKPEWFREGIKIASRQIGPADASLEKDIAGKHALLRCTIKHDTARRMSRYMNGLQTGVAKSYDISIVDITAQCHLWLR